MNSCSGSVSAGSSCSHVDVIIEDEQCLSRTNVLAVVVFLALFMGAFPSILYTYWRGKKNF